MNLLQDQKCNTILGIRLDFLFNNVLELCLKWLLSHKLTLASRSDHCPPFSDQMSEKVVKILLLYSEVLFVSLIPLRGGSACDLYRW